LHGPVGLPPSYPGLQEQTPGSRQEPWQEAGQLGWLQNIPVGEGGHFLIFLIFTLALLVLLCHLYWPFLSP
jgi:hypothetical protein